MKIGIEIQGELLRSFDWPIRGEGRCGIRYAVALANIGHDVTLIHHTPQPAWREQGVYVTHEPDLLVQDVLIVQSPQLYYDALVPRKFAMRFGVDDIDREYGRHYEANICHASEYLQYQENYLVPAYVEDWIEPRAKINRIFMAYGNHQTPSLFVPLVNAVKAIQIEQDCELYLSKTGFIFYEDAAASAARAALINTPMVSITTLLMFDDYLEVLSHVCVVVVPPMSTSFVILEGLASGCVVLTDKSTFPQEWRRGCHEDFCYAEDLSNWSCDHFKDFFLKSIAFLRETHDPYAGSYLVKQEFSITKTQEAFRGFLRE